MKSFRNVYVAMSKASGRAVTPILLTDLQDPADNVSKLYIERLKSCLFTCRKNAIVIDL